MIWAVLIFLLSAAALVILYRGKLNKGQNEAKSIFRTLIILDARGNVEFNGETAIVHAQHSVYVGSDLEGADSRLKTKYLCKTESGIPFEVVIEGTSSINPASSKVVKLSEAAFTHRLKHFPYKKTK